MNNVIAYGFSLVSLCISGVVTYYLNKSLKLNDKKEEEKKSREVATMEGVQALLRVKLIEYHDKFMANGSIPKYALENFELMYQAYKGVNGNGMVTKLHEEVVNLPTEY